MNKRKPPKIQSSTLVQSSAFRLPGQSESSDQILRAVRGEFYESIAEVLRTARSNTYRAVNLIMVEAYWNIGQMIVEEEQQGKERAEYGAALIKNLSVRLTEEFGKGFTERNLRQIRQFYLVFPPEGHKAKTVHKPSSESFSPASRCLPAAVRRS